MNVKINEINGFEPLNCLLFCHEISDILSKRPAYVPAYEMFAREFGRAIPNVNETHQRRSTALSANTLWKKEWKLFFLISVWQRIFRSNKDTYQL